MIDQTQALQTRKQLFSSKEFEAIYSKVPRLCVEVLVKTDRGIILTKRAEQSWNGLWHIPGGTVFIREKLHEAVKRIAVEELGIEMNIEKLVGYIEYPSEEKERGFGWSVGIAFLCNPVAEIDFGRWQPDQVEGFMTVPENMIEEQKRIVSEQLSRL